MTRLINRIPIPVLILALAAILCLPQSRAVDPPQTLSVAVVNLRLSAGETVVIVPGRYDLDSPLVVGVNARLVCDGARFAVKHTGPAVTLSGRMSALRGGRFDFPANSVGPLILVANCTQARIQDVQLFGGAQRLAVGIQIEGTAPTYFARVIDVDVSNVKTAVRLGTNANGCQVRGLSASQVGETGIEIDGGGQNRVEGFIGGNGGAAVTAIRLAGKAYANHVAVTAEPGGRAVPYWVGEGCNSNQIVGQLNCAGAGSDGGLDNLIVRLGSKRNF